jgi:U3 small nucleolar RNA-associated protein 7
LLLIALERLWSLLESTRLFIFGICVKTKALFCFVLFCFFFFFSKKKKGTYGKIQTIRTRRVAGQLDVSARGMLAVGDGTFLDVYNSSILSGGGSASGTPEPYMRVHTGSRHDVVHAARFCPWEDVLGVGSASGFRSAIIPGCGEPNLDTFEANPFASRQQRREGDVQALLDKAEPATIMLHPAQLGSLQPVPQDQEKDKKSMEKHKPRQKARESSGQRQRRKEAMSDAEFLQERKQKVLEERQRELEEKAEQRSQKKKKKAEASGDILARFLK